MNATELKVKMGVNVRWAIRRDTLEIVDIERRSTERPWSEDEYLNEVRQRNQIAMVAERGSRVLGYTVYKLHRDQIELIRLVVDAEFQRHRVGTQLVEKLFGKLHANRRTTIKLVARETEMPGLLFLRVQGFVATGVERGYFGDSGEDGYAMEYRLSANESWNRPLVGVERGKF